MASFLGRVGRWSFNSRGVLQRRFASNEASHLEMDCNAEGNKRLLIAAVTLPITMYLVYITHKRPTLAQYEKRYGPLPPNVKEKLNIDSETLKERIREKLSTTPDAFKHYKIDREVLKKYDIDPKMLKPPKKA